MTTRGRVRLGVQGVSEVSKIEGNHRAGQPSARMRPQPLVWLVHAYLQKSEYRDARADGLNIN